MSGDAPPGGGTTGCGGATGGGRAQNGVRAGLLPKTRLKQALLHDNKYEEACLRNKLHQLDLQEKWSVQVLEIQRRAFLVRQLYQQQRMRDAGLHHVTLIPSHVEHAHRDAATFRARHNGVKDLPPYQHLKVADINKAQDALFNHPRPAPK